VALIGAYVRGLSERISENKREIDILRTSLNAAEVRLAADHHTKDEANAQFHELKSAITALHRRLDFFQFPRGLGPPD
jgi:predicted kinase